MPEAISQIVHDRATTRWLDQLNAQPVTVKGQGFEVSGMLRKRGGIYVVDTGNSYVCLGPSQVDVMGNVITFKPMREVA